MIENGPLSETKLKEEYISGIIDGRCVQHSSIDGEVNDKYAQDAVPQHKDETAERGKSTNENLDRIFSVGARSKPSGPLEPIAKTHEINKKKKKKQTYLKRISAKVSSLPDVISEDARTTSQTNSDGDDKRTKTNEVKQPFRYYVFVSKYPVIAFILASSVHIITIVATVSLIASGSDVFPFQFTSLPLILTNDSTRKKDLAWRSKNDYDLRIIRYPSGIQYPYWRNGQLQDIVEVIFEVDTGFIFSERNLHLLSETENRLFYHTDYQLHYCQKLENGNCTKPWSVLRLFDGTYEHVDKRFATENYSFAKHVICNATRFNETKDFVEYFLEKDANPCSSDFVTSRISRIFFMMGYPLKNGNSKSRTESFLVNHYKPEIEHIRDNYLKDRIDVYYLSKLLFDHDVEKQAMTDMKLTIGSFTFIFLVMWIETGSFFITFLGIFSIITSFLLTNLIYRYALNYMYFGFFHIIAMFIILGIGADDVFVFYDAWRLTGNFDYPSKAHRLADCYGRAAKSTFVTSVTTASAFLVSGISPLLPVSSFGIFTGILVLVNYVCDLIYFPSVIMLYSVKIKPFTDWLYSVLTEKICARKTCCSSICVGWKNGKQELENKSKEHGMNDEFPCDSEREESFLSIGSTSYPKYAKYKSSNKKSRGTPKTTSSDVDHVKEKDIPKSHTKKSFEERNKIVSFFIHKFYYFLNLRVVKVLTPFLFLGVSIVFFSQSLNLEADSKQVQIYKETHNYGKASTLHYYGFKRNFEEEYTSVYLVWGMEENDMSSCNTKSGKFCAGKHKFISSFNPSEHEAQSALYDLCKRMDSLSDDMVQKLSIRRNSKTNKPEINCFMTPLQEFLKAEQNYSGTMYPADMSLDIPLDRHNLTLFMEANKHIYDVNGIPSDYNNYLEIGTAYWLTNKYSGYNTQDYFEYNGLLGEQWISGTSSYARNSYLSMYYGTRLKYIGVRANLTVSVYTLGYEQGIPIYEAWESLIENEQSKMPPSLHGGFQCTKNTWHWIKVQQELVESAITWIVASLCLTCPILTLTTMNLVIGILATVCIGLITTCVVGIIPVAGWKLGVLESLNLCMVVGLSVDYIVHLAEAYQTAPSKNRQDRVLTMLRSKGLSVFSGAVTTFGAAVILLFAQIQFLYQFGIFVMTTTSISLGFSLLGFSTLMALCGPQGNTGSLKSLIQKCIPKTYCNKGDSSKVKRWSIHHMLLSVCHLFSPNDVIKNSIKSTKQKSKHEKPEDVTREGSEPKPENCANSAKITNDQCLSKKEINSKYDDTMKIDKSMASRNLAPSTGIKKENIEHVAQHCLRSENLLHSGSNTTAEKRSSVKEEIRSREKHKKKRRKRSSSRKEKDAKHSTENHSDYSTCTAINEGQPPRTTDILTDRTQCGLQTETGNLTISDSVVHDCPKIENYDVHVDDDKDKDEDCI